MARDRTTITLEVLEVVEVVAVVGYFYFVLTGRYALSLIAPKTLLFEFALGLFFIVLVIGMLNLLYRWTLPLHGSGLANMISGFLWWLKDVIFSWRVFLILEALVVQGFLQSRIFKQSKLRWVMHMTLAWGCLIFLVLYIIDIKELIVKLPYGNLAASLIDVGILFLAAITAIGLVTAMVRGVSRPGVLVILLIAGIMLWFLVSLGGGAVDYLYGAGLFVYERILYNLAAILVFIGLTIVFIRRRSKEVKPLTDFRLDVPSIILVTVLSATGFAGFYLQYISAFAHEVIIHIHFITTFGVIAYFPFSKFLHIPAAKLTYILNAVEVHH